jgi:hypothetical protein
MIQSTSFNSKYELYAAVLFYTGAVMRYLSVQGGILLMLFTFFVFSGITFINMMADIRAGTNSVWKLFLEFWTKNAVLVSVFFAASAFPGKWVIAIVAFISALVYLLLLAASGDAKSKLYTVLFYFIATSVLDYLFLY